MNSMLVVGITGRSGSGKSSVAEYYAGLGYPVEDGDALSRFVCRAGSACVRELEEAFGPGVVAPDGSLKRRELAALVFDSPKKNEQLLSIVHPYILKELQKREKKARAKDAKLFFLDGAMIVGSLFEEHCDAIILVESAQKLSLSRIILRDGISKAAAHKRLGAQPPESTLRLAATYRIENNGSVESLHHQADDVLAQLLKSANTNGD